jgi:hypothetical protein
VSPSLEVGIRNAAQTWNEAVGFELIRIDEATDNFRGSLYERLDDDLVTAGEERFWCRTGKSRTVLATATWENEPDSDVISEGDIIFNTEVYRFGDSMAETQQTEDPIVADAESVALHELGHLLGLDHISLYFDRLTVMTPQSYIGPGQSQRQLSTGDIERVRSIYNNVDGTEPPLLEMRRKIVSKQESTPETNANYRWAGCDFESDG